MHLCALKAKILIVMTIFAMWPVSEAGLFGLETDFQHVSAYTDASSTVSWRRSLGGGDLKEVY